MQKGLKQQVSQWIAKRFQVDSVKTLLQKDVLVFIYKQGFLYLILILITFIAGINYGNNLILGFCFLLSAILCISFYLTFKQLHDLKIEIVMPEVGQVNQPSIIRLMLKQQDKTVRYLRIESSQQEQMIFLNQVQQTVELPVLPQQRGLYEFGVIKVYSTYPLGLVRAWTYLYPKQKYGLHLKLKIGKKNIKTSRRQHMIVWMNLKNYVLFDRETPTRTWHGNKLLEDKDSLLKCLRHKRITSIWKLIINRFQP